MIHVYTGNGKGKTTAALGLCLRAIGAGMRVYIMQFMKSLAYSEQAVLKSFGTHLVNLHTTGKPFFVAPEGTMSEAEREKWGDDVEVFQLASHLLNTLPCYQGAYQRLPKA